MGQGIGAEARKVVEEGIEVPCRLSHRQESKSFPALQVAR